ncbi:MULTISPECIES: hypothetical protein [Streptomyces]|uniref:Membrane protein n=1 Tax=Streptomyces thermogriseus TaxID=75292 RepID=A0ABN1T1V7_9ACTN|nr:MULTISPECIES: hypothetical protein [Streptomyces]MDN5381689.1 hypothetical protein [Streptomyces sp. LB8]
MSTAYVPQQPRPTRTGASPEPPPTPPYASEATRLLCVGTYLDPAFRDRVIEELHLNEQRFVAPSLGLDVARVLAHALRARRIELQWAGAILALWAAGAALTRGLLLIFALPGLLIVLAGWGRARGAPRWRLPASLLRCAGGLLSAGLLFLVLRAAFTGHPIRVWQAWAVLVTLALVGVCERARRDQLARALTGSLSREAFPDAAADPAERGGGPRFQRLKDQIRLEQHSPLVMYHEARPFCGAGEARDTWVLAVELKPDDLKKEQRPLSNRAILDSIRPRLEQLRLPAEHAERAGLTVRDRLRRLEIDECVFLPAEGERSRAEAPFHPEAVAEHCARAVEEGGEKRRHFLRIRVGGWEEELVVTVFVRVHTQGRMLVLEIAPHVLLPVREDFKEAPHSLQRNTPVGRAAEAALHVPGSVLMSLYLMGRAVMYVLRMLTGGYAQALPDGPALSVRELGSAPDGSQFQTMDVSRYLKSIQDRVANGVRAALADFGYQTGEFVQQINNISNGGVHIGRVEGSTFAVGEHASASTTAGGPVPREDTGAREGTGRQEGSVLQKGSEPQEGRGSDDHE